MNQQNQDRLRYLGNLRQLCGVNRFTYSEGKMDGVRAYEWPAVIRAVNTVDAMTAEVPELDWALLKKIGDRIASEVPGICRVLYDLTPKPCGTIEFE